MSKRAPIIHATPSFNYVSERLKMGKDDSASAYHKRGYESQRAKNCNSHVYYVPFRFLPIGLFFLDLFRRLA